MEPNENEIPIPSVNVQIAAGVICVGLWALGVNRKLGLLTRSINQLNESMHYSTQALGILAQDAVVAQDILRLVTTTTKGS